MLLNRRNKVPVILIHPDRRLARIAKPVNFDSMSLFERTRIVRRMGAALGATTYGERLGLAATQIGINYRVIIVRGNVMFNPSWTPTKAPPNFVTEGCYSVPGRLFKVYRAQYGWAKWTDINGRPMEDKLNGLPAIVFQHEIDHLDGKCCADTGVEIKEETGRVPQSKSNINQKSTMGDLSKFKVLVAFELDGVNQEVDSVVELSEEVTAPLVAEGKLEAVAADSAE